MTGSSTRGKARLFLIALFVFTAIPLVFTQEVSKKKEIAVFNLSYYKWTIPNSALGSIDEQIRSVFINLGRFDVIGMTYRLGENDVNDFIEKIKKYKEENAVIPEKVQMGQEFFTQADFNKLIASFITVIPAVTYYNTEKTDKGDIKVTIKTSFTFVNVEQIKSFAQFFVETTGTDESSSKAVQAAVDNIPTQLTFEIRKIPDFQLKTGILEVKGSEVILEFGRNMGLKLGDEYVILASKVLESGRTYTEEKGLIIIKEVSDEISTGKIIYSTGKPQMGEQLKEIPRLGMDTTPYVHFAFGTSGFLVMAGARQSLTRGFYTFRPHVGLELPIMLLAAGGGIPLNFYAGGEMSLYLGRLQLVPMISIGIGGYIPLSKNDEFSLSHAGGMANVTLSYLLTRDIKVVADAGYLQWFDVRGLASSYGGISAGGGVSIKY